MFSTGPKQPSSIPYGRGRQRGLPPFARGREVQTLFMAIAGLALVAVLASIFMDLSRRAQPPPEAEGAVPVETLDPMPLPTLDEAPPLPDEAAVEESVFQARFLKDEPQSLRLRDLDALTIAWARIRLAEDREHQPVVQRFGIQDLMQGQVRHGTILVVRGTVLFSRKETIGEEEWVRFVLEVDRDRRQYLEGLAAPGAGYIEDGVEHYLVGRYAGNASLPAEDGSGPVTLPVLLVRKADAVEKTSVESVLALPPQEAEFTRFTPDPGVFDEIDDPGTVLEYRPYYHLLGQVALDSSTPGVYAEPLDANAMANQLHREPQEHRGQVFTVEGTVDRACEDYLVSRDTPYGVHRVFRIWLGRFEWGEDAASHCYEVAAIVDGDAELPRKGDRVRATGRFLKVQGYRVDLNWLRDMANDIRHRRSNNAYFKFFVTPGFDIRPRSAPRDWLWVKIVFSIVSLSLVVSMVVLIHRDHRHENDARAPLRKLREGRRRLKQKLRDRSAEEGGADDDGGGDDAGDPDPAPDSDPGPGCDPDPHPDSGSDPDDDTSPDLHGPSSG